MGWLSGIVDAGIDAGKDAGGDIKPLKGPTIPDPPEPVRPEPPIDAPPKDGPAAPTKPTGSSGGLVAGAGVALGGLGFILPTILNSSAVSGAIAGGAQVGTAVVLGNDVKDVLNGLFSGITSSPENMAIAAAGSVVLIYLLLK